MSKWIRSLSVFHPARRGARVFQKSLCAGLAAVVALAASGCSSADRDDALTTVKPQSNISASSPGVSLSSISLAANVGDSFNPYTAKTLVNSTLFPLLYDSLVKLDAKLAPQNALASKISVSGSTCTVTLKDGLKFSDGSALTAKAVVYSANRAKSSPLYGGRLKNMASVSANGDKKVVFTLSRPDRNFASLLDFPIVKEETAKDSKSTPVGSGRYTLKSQGNKNYSLEYNTRWYKKADPKFKTISLVAPPDDEAIMTSVKTGNVALMFSDLSKGEIGGIGAATQPVALNNMIYIGINSSNGVLQSPEFRSALSFAIDRKAVLSKGYSGRGTATYLPVNPLFDLNETLTGDEFPGYNQQKAGSMLDALGYDKTDMSAVRLNGESPITLNLLINGDNNYKVLTANAIKNALREVGIGINIVTEKDFDAFSSKVKSKNFDLYLGETKLLFNMDISDFWRTSPLNAGISASEELKNAYTAYQNGSGTYAAFAKIFAKETPFIPLLFRSGIVAYNRNIQTQIVATPSDVFDNITDWK